MPRVAHEPDCIMSAPAANIIILLQKQGASMKESGVHKLCT